MIERIPIASREEWLALRSRDVTASVAGALLGVHEYITPYGLWALKSGRVMADAEETPAMIRGRLLEPVELDLLREHRPGWEITVPGAYYRDPAARLGATPDAFALDPERKGYGHGVVQIKTVEPSIFRRKWRTDDGAVEVPLWIAVQALVEAELTGASWAAVAALRVGHGLDLDIVNVPLHRPLLDRLKAEVAAFWRRVESGRPPDPDLGRDGALIESLYAPSGETADLSADNYALTLVDERERLSADKTAAEKRLREIKSELLVKLGGASSARLADGRLLTAAKVHRKAYEVKASEYLTSGSARLLELQHERDR